MVFVNPGVSYIIFMFFISLKLFTVSIYMYINIRNFEKIYFYNLYNGPQFGRCIFLSLLWADSCWWVPNITHFNALFKYVCNSQLISKFSATVLNISTSQSVSGEIINTCPITDILCLWDKVWVAVSNDCILGQGVTASVTLMTAYLGKEWLRLLL